MKAINNLVTKLFRSPIKKRDESGLSLTEILVSIGLLSVVTIMVVSLITSNLNSASKYSNVTASQGEVATAMTNIQRDLSSSQKVLKATNNSITVQLRNNSKDYEITYFVHDPHSGARLPDRVIASSLPTDYKAIIEVRYDVAANKVGQKIIVKGYNEKGFKETEKQRLFDYFDTNNTKLTVPVLDNSGATANRNTLDKVTRVEFRLSAEAEGRGTPIQMESSASINTGSFGPSVAPGELYASVPVCPANFQAVIVEREQKATITWYSSPGATSYTLYRTNTATNTLEKSYVIANPDTLSFVDTGLEWGVTYRWTIQANGSGGNSPACGPTTATVVPEAISFVNINSLAGLDETKPNANADTKTRNNGTNLGTKNVTTSGKLMGGNKYTVARGLANQLAWDGTTRYNGTTTGYRIYETTNLTTPVAEINSAGTQFTRLTKHHTANINYGDVTKYVIKAYNAGGESFASGEQQLISPPKASAIGVHKPDTDAPNNYTYANFTVTNRAANTDGFKSTLVRGLDPTVACSNLTVAEELNFSGNNKSDAKAPWGSTTCYIFTPFNDAGSGVETALTNVKQKPGGFVVERVFNLTDYRTIDEGAGHRRGGFPDNRWCWSDPIFRNGTEGHGPGGVNPLSCHGNSIGHHAYQPLGAFKRSQIESANIQVVWSRSQNAAAGYEVKRKRVVTSGIVDQAPQGELNPTTPYVDSTQSLEFRNEMPGSMYEFKIIAKAKNGEERHRDAAPHFTRPDVPKYVGGDYEDKKEGGRIVTRQNRLLEARALRGVVDGFTVNMYVPQPGNPYVTTRRDIGVVNHDVHVTSEPQTVAGHNFREAFSYTNFGGRVGTIESKHVGAVGLINGFSCVTACNDWRPWGAYYPNYYSGWPAAASSGGHARNSEIVVGNNSAAEAVLPKDYPVSEAGKVCAVLPEETIEFSVDCINGTGIPPVPNNVQVLEHNGADRLVKWVSWPGVTKYTVSVLLNGTTTPTIYETANPQQIVNIPSGAVAKVTVKATNPTAESGVSAPVEYVAGPMPVPTNVTITDLNPTGMKVNWVAAPYATSYTVTYWKGSEAPAVKTVTGVTNAVLTGLAANSEYNIQVTATNGKIVSTPTTIVKGKTPEAPLATPTGLYIKGTTQTGNGVTSTIVWNTVPNAAKYRVRVVTDNVETTYDVTSNTYNVAVPYTKQSTVSVAAISSTGLSSGYSTTLNATAPLTLVAPTGLTTTGISSTKVKVAWNATVGAVKYNLKVERTPGAVVNNYDNITAPTYDVTILPSDTKLVLTLTAVAADGTVSPSATVTYTVPVATPGSAPDFTYGANNVVLGEYNLQSNPTLIQPVTCAAGSTAQYRMVQISPVEKTSVWSTSLVGAAPLNSILTTYQLQAEAKCVTSAGVSSTVTQSAVKSFTPKYNGMKAPVAAPTTSTATVNVGKPFSFTLPPNVGSCHVEPGATAPKIFPYYKVNDGPLVKAESVTVNITPTVAGTQKIVAAYACALPNGENSPITAASFSPALTVTAQNVVPAPANAHLVGNNGSELSFAWNNFEHSQYVIVVTGPTGKFETAGSSKTGAKIVNRFINPTDKIKVEIFAANGATKIGSGVTILNNFAPTTFDFNNDGYPDVPYIDAWDTNAAIGYGYEGLDSITTFGDPETVQMGGDWKGATKTIAGVELNGDKYVDLLMVKNNQLTAYYGTANTAVFTKQYLFTLPNSTIVANGLGDVNGDGIMDLVTKEGTQGKVYYGNANGTFQTNGVVITNDWGNVKAVSAPIDFNGDGYADFMVQKLNNTLTLYTGSANRTSVTSSFSSAFASYLTLLTPGDINSDGNPDVLAYDDTSKEVQGRIVTNSKFSNTVDHYISIYGRGDFTIFGARKVDFREDSSSILVFSDDSGQLRTANISKNANNKFLDEAVEDYTENYIPIG